MTRALDVIAQIVTGDEEADRDAVPCQAIRYQHAEAICVVLAERYAHSTANKMLSALRQTLKAAWKLGLMSAEAYQQAASVENVRGDGRPGAPWPGASWWRCWTRATRSRRVSATRPSSLCCTARACAARRSSASTSAIMTVASSGVLRAADAISSAACPSSPGRRRGGPVFSQK